MLAGSGGMGKTRLAQQLAAQAEQRARRRAVGTLPGRTRRAAVLALAPADPQLPAQRRRRRSGQTFGAGLAGHRRHRSRSWPSSSAPCPLDREDAATARSRAFACSTRSLGFWRRAAQRAPLLLIFEDLHWADATSLRLFSVHGRRTRRAAACWCIGTYRDTELSRQHPLFDTLAELARSPVFQRIELTGLSSRETEQFISRRRRQGRQRQLRQRAACAHRRPSAVPGGDAALHDGSGARRWRSTCPAAMRRRC